MSEIQKGCSWQFFCSVWSPRVLSWLREWPEEAMTAPLTRYLVPRWRCLKGWARRGPLRSAKAWPLPHRRQLLVWDRLQNRSLQQFSASPVRLLTRPLRTPKVRVPDRGGGSSQVLKVCTKKLVVWLLPYSTGHGNYKTHSTPFPFILLQ